MNEQIIIMGEEYKVIRLLVNGVECYFVCYRYQRGVITCFDDEENAIDDFEELEREYKYENN